MCVFWERQSRQQCLVRESLWASFGIVLKVKAVVMRVNGVYFWRMRMHEQVTLGRCRGRRTASGEADTRKHSITVSLVKTHSHYRNRAAAWRHIWRLYATDLFISGGDEGLWNRRMSDKQRTTTAWAILDELGHLFPCGIRALDRRRQIKRWLILYTSLVWAFHHSCALLEATVPR